MVPGGESPCEPLLSEQTDVQQGLQVLGKASAGLIHVKDILKKSRVYHLEQKLRETISSLSHCVVFDSDDNDLKYVKNSKFQRKNPDINSFGATITPDGSLRRRECAIPFLVSLRLDSTTDIKSMF